MDIPWGTKGASFYPLQMANQIIKMKYDKVSLEVCARCKSKRGQRIRIEERALWHIYFIYKTMDLAVCSHLSFSLDHAFLVVVLFPQGLEIGSLRA